MAAGPNTSSVATNDKARSRRPPAFACDQSSSSLSFFSCSLCSSSCSLSSLQATSYCKSLSVTLADTHLHSSKIPSSALSPSPKPLHHAIDSPASATLLVANEMRNHHYRPRESDLLSETLDRALSADDEEDRCCFVYATRHTRR
jgi:hypothetical protein